MAQGYPPEEDAQDNVKLAIHSFCGLLRPGATLSHRVQPAAHPMQMGLDGTSGRLDGAEAGKSYWIKVPDNEQRRWIDTSNGALIAAAAGKAGIAPALVLSDEQTGALLFDDLGEEWKFAIVADFRESDTKADVVEKAIVATRSLHQLKLNALPGTLTVFERIDEMRQLMENGAVDPVNGKTVRVVLPENYLMMRDHVARIAAAFAVAGSDFAPCHGDNSLSNIMIGPAGDIKLVDFDRAANDDPMSDLGALCNEYCRIDEDIARAVEIYAGRADKRLIARVKLHMIAASFYWGMWGKVSNTITPRRDIEFYKYGENQFMRCAANISRWDVDALMRAL